MTVSLSVPQQILVWQVHVFHTAIRVESFPLYLMGIRAIACDIDFAMQKILRGFRSETSDLYLIPLSFRTESALVNRTQISPIEWG